MRLPEVLRFLILGYAFSLPLRRVLYLPVVESKLQVPELLFLLLAPLALWIAKDKRWPGWHWFTGGLLSFFLLSLLASVRSGNPGSILEAAGRLYLIILLFIVTWFVRRQGRAGSEALLRYWSWGCVLMALVGYTGYALGLAGHVTKFVVLYENYPYFGTVLRAASTAGSPMATVMVALLPFIWHYRRWRSGRGGRWFLLLLAPLFLLTLAKEVLIVALGCWLVDPTVARVPKLKYGAAALGVAALWFSTSYLVERTHDYSDAELQGVVFTGGRVAARIADWQLTETSYTELKRANLKIAQLHPWGGVGLDQSGDYLKSVSAAGYYAKNLPVYRSHSTWFGALAETGFPGGAVLLVTAIGLGAVVRRNALRWPEDDVAVCLSAFFLLVAATSLSEEFLALRFVYVAAGMALGGALISRP